MKRRGVIAALAVAVSGCFATAATPDGAEIFHSKCQLCHTTRQVAPAEREKLLGPPIDEVMLRVKEKYPIREDAVHFIADYVRFPSIDKALCPSLDRYGLMPSLKKTLSRSEAESVGEMLFDTFPRNEPARKSLRHEGNHSVGNLRR